MQTLLTADQTQVRDSNIHLLIIHTGASSAVRTCVCVCVCDREREREKERKGKEKERAQGSLRVCRQQWSGCFVTVLGRAQEMHHDAASHSWISSTIRIDFFFFPERPDSPSIQYHNASAEVWSVRQSKPENVVYILTVHLEKNCF